MDQGLLLLAGFAVLLTGALAASAIGSRRPALLRGLGLLAIAGAAACFGLVSAQVLRTGAALGPITLWRPALVPASLTIRVDALSAFFLLLISGLSVAAAWFAVGYTRRMEHLGRFYPPLLLFVFGMAGVVVMDDFLFFFVPWELMALASYLLVVCHREQEGTLAAGFRYFFVTHAGTLALLFGVAMLAGAGGGFGFANLAGSMPALLAGRPVLAHAALLLILLGFLVKAGCFPFGMWWLPAAHPAAPSPASALLSGAMIKLGLYGILRVFLQVLPPGPWSLGWGLTIGAFGTLSLFLGTIAALFQRDSKRLLACSSIGQVGYMLLGFGIAVGLATSNPALAAVGLVGGLFHVLNHACFKGLLFLGAGSFELASGQRDLDRLGGLGPVVPLTALSAVIASASIAGLPPFNGFSSKWLLYHASIWGSQGPRVAFLFFGIAALFVSAVTLALFVKFLGATVWGPPSPEVARAVPPRENPWIGPPQLALAAACLLLGVFPVAGARLSYLAAQPLAGGPGAPLFASLFGAGRFALEVRDAGTVVGAWAPLGVTLIFAAAFGVAVAIRRSAAAPARATSAWACGSEVEAEQLRFRARHYYTPFKALIRPLAVLPVLPAPWRAAARRLRPPASTVTGTLNPDGWAYRPLVAGLLSSFRWLSASKAGLPQVYPAWNLIGLALSFVVLLLLSL
ncbi:MAG: dehydrogenase (quinone) [Acidobacteria bacterium]|nr:dehydrogenase (quinone) [Acidobacteriota bacterium]